MRPVVLFPLAALLVVAAGCGSEAREPSARSELKRDLTLVSGAAGVEVASPVETRQIRPQHRSDPSSRPAARSSRAPLATSRVTLIDVWAPGPLTAAPRPVVQPATPEASSENSRELLPGKTVTLIPASSGPAVETDRAGDLPEISRPTMIVRGGGTCGGRGRAPGIGKPGSPAPDFR
jgi:hypothetical protein